MTSSTWTHLPTEMKLAVMDYLNLDDTKALSRVHKEIYALCVPRTFQDVKLNDYDALRKFLIHVPQHYYHYIHDVDVCTHADEDSILRDFANSSEDSIHPRTDALASLLNACTRIEKLSLKLDGSLDKSIISCFSHLSELKALSIGNWGEEAKMPISERLVVSIAASVPGLEQLALEHITRSTIHAPELVGVYPYIPLAFGDSDIPNHPLLGADLYLPSLLRLPSLRKLVIRDTHLGDPRWATTPVDCRLEMLDLGSCYHENDDFNKVCTERIMAVVGPTIDEFSLTTAVSDTIFAEPSVTPLKRLRKLHIGPYFPLDNMVETVSNMAGSPIESLSTQCHEDDVVDVCDTLEEFLNVRVERGPDFYSNLARIDVSIIASEFPGTAKPDDEAERKQAVQRLQEFCHDLRLRSKVGDAPGVPNRQCHTAYAGYACAAAASCPRSTKEMFA